MIGMEPVTLQTTQGLVVYYDPVTFLLIMLFAVIITGVAFWFYFENRRQNMEASLVSAEVNSINVQTGMMANLTQATVNALNTNTATFQQATQAEITNYSKLVDAMVNYMNLMASTYVMQAQHSMAFQDNILNLLAMQMGVQDIRQLQSDKLKVSTVEAFKPATIEVTANPQQGTTSTKS